MPRNLRNWSFEDVRKFLEQNHFVCVNTIGSHYYYRGRVDGEDRLVEVQRHPNGTIPPKTLRHYVIYQSGMPEKIWLEWVSARNNKRKQIIYSGAEPWQK